MARKMSFGKILRDARHKKHMDITTAAARLRIRSDILQAIEEEDFSRMPPHGYTRNMIGAYARLLGLNGSDVTRIYLDEAYAREVGKARNDTTLITGSRRTSSRDSRAAQRMRETQEQRTPKLPHDKNTGRAIYNDRDDRTPRTYATDRVHPSKHAPMPTTQYTNFYAGPVKRGVSLPFPLIIAAAVVIIILIIVFIFIFAPKPQETKELPNVPIAGVTDTSNNQSQTDQSATPVPPAQAIVSYSVANGKTAYIEVYIDGASSPTVAGDFTGPATRSFDVTGTLRFVTTSPEDVELTVDGAVVEPTDNSDSGVYSYTVDFPAILAQWQKDNAPANAGSGGTATTTTDNSGTASGSR